MGQESGVFRSLGLSEEMLFAVNAKFMVVRCKKAGYGGFAMVFPVAIGEAAYRGGRPGVIHCIVSLA